jgi:hypothetical protein
MLFALHLLALGVATVIFFAMIVLHRRAREMERKAISDIKTFSPGGALAQCPAAWLAIRSTDSKAVLTAMGLSYPVPCSWKEGITGERELFIGTPVNGWILVTGSRLPQPGRDVDACFHFLVRLSRALGHVQFFMADAVRRHHAWVRVENGMVTRAYAWVNETVWNQGPKTLAEIELNMKCFNYAENAETGARTREPGAAANVEKLPALAARWSLDPAAVNAHERIPADGIAEKPARWHQD